MDDAFHATKAAVQEGVVPGGGVALLRAQKGLEGLELSDEERVGANIVRRALEEPLRTIASNAGLEPSVVIDKVRAGQGSYGYNAATDTYEDLVESGVIDPTKVVRTALQNAASVASLILTTECVIAEAPPKEKGKAGAAAAMDM